MRSLQVAFAVLEEIAEAQVIGVSELARRLNLPKATVQRSLRALADVRYVVRADKTQWQLSARVLGLASQMKYHDNLARAARPAMKDLCDEVDETIHLTVREDRWVVLVSLVEPTRPVRTTAHISSMQLAHATATGKAMLSALSDEDVRELLGTGLETPTERTIATIPALLKALAQIRQRGYAINDREYQIDTASIAAPIRDASGRTVAAMSISSPATRLKRNLWKPYGEAVARAASRVQI
ncbi:MAG: IclR family transcriptional regulator [Cumulibacter sp.]